MVRRAAGIASGIQLAVAHGLKFFSTAGPSKQDYLRKIGVDHAIDYEKSNFMDVVRKFAPDGIEMVMDPIGGKSFANSYKCLGPTGRLVVYGFSAAAGNDGKKNLLRSAKALAETPRFHPLKLMSQNISVIGVSYAYDSKAPAARRTRRDFRCTAAGKVKPVIGKTFSAG